MIWKPRPYDKAKEEELIRNGQSKLLARLLAQRNIEPEDVPAFLSSNYEDLSHPYRLGGIKEAVDIFVDAIQNKRTTALYSDYDSDGVMSAVLIKELCNCFDHPCTIFLPSRREQGYGLNPKSVEDFKTKLQTPPDLLFVLDCGTNSEIEIQNLKAWGVKQVVIFDHHIVDPNKMTKSADVLINWHLCDYSETCTGGEVFQFIRGIRWLTKKVNPIEFLPYAAISILADVSPIIGDNRIIVRNGLKEYAMKHLTSSGLICLLRKSGVYSKDISQEDVLFKIAPRINAVGRLEKPDIAFNLLIEQDLSTAELIAQCMSERNDERKKIQKQMTREAILNINANLKNYPNGILVFNPNWNIGVVGLVASRLVEHYFMPAIVAGQNGEIWKGSGRSLEGVNLKAILDSCNGIFDTFGGHEMACGVTLNKDNLSVANQIFNEACGKYYEKHGRPEEIRYYDAMVKPSSLNLHAAKGLLKTLYPYCSQYNPEPIFLMPDVTISDTELFGKEEQKMLAFNVERDGKKSAFPLRSFTDVIGTEINGCKADVYVTLPQTINANPKFRTFLNVVDIVLKK